VPRQLNYDRFVSFEWKTKWHPEIEDGNIASAHFSRGFGERWEP
jgi:hypothetical protein